MIDDDNKVHEVYCSGCKEYILMWGLQEDECPNCDAMLCPGDEK